MFRTRREAIHKKLIHEHADALLVSDFRNIAYLTGFRGLSPHERESLVLVTGDTTHLVVPPMYYHEAQSLESVVRGEVTLHIDEARKGLLALCAMYMPKHGRVLFEDHDVSVAEFERIARISTTTLVAGKQCVEDIRLIKDADEIVKITRAVEITDKVFLSVVEYIGRCDYTRLSEAHIVEYMRTQQQVHGGEGFGFDPIVACGRATALPHHRSSHANILDAGGLLLVDSGMMYHSYTGDLTRCIGLGSVPSNQRKAYDIVRTCTEECVARCKPGITCGELYDYAYAFLEKHDMARHFVHTLGHGIGLNIHEAPSLRKGNVMELQPGMIVTIEPGAYWQDKFGVRFEDVVCITSNGSRLLSTQSSRKLDIIV